MVSINKKRVVIQIRLDDKQKEIFEMYCRDLGTTMSDELKRYIVRCNKSVAKKSTDNIIIG